MTTNTTPPPKLTPTQPTTETPAFKREAERWKKFLEWVPKREDTSPSNGASKT